MKFLNKMERKFGKYAIQNLMLYVIVLHVMGLVISMANPYLLTYLNFDITKILEGQMWRIFTFLVQPPEQTNIIFIFFELYLYYIIGTALEGAWGTFRLNLYFLLGIIFNLLGTILIYFITSSSILGLEALNASRSLQAINRSMFFAFAAIYPNVEFRIYFFIPVKVKYLAYLYAGIQIYALAMGIQQVFSGNIFGWVIAISVITSILNFILFFYTTKNYKRIRPSEMRRQHNFRSKMASVKKEGHKVDIDGVKVVAIHKCAICGRTEHDNDHLEFRFCSRCNGSYEYCTDHLFSHEHVE